MSSLQKVKLFLVDHLDLAKDALHIYVALAIFLGACLVFGWKARQWKPWLLVLVVAIIGELWDIRDSIADDDPVRPWANWKDVWNTMIAPTLLLLFARFTGVFAKPPVAEEAVSGDEAEVAAGPAGGERDIG